MRVVKSSVVAVALVWWCAGAQATTWHVPAQCPTIQAGIDSAAEWDTVLVAPGNYWGDGNRDIDFRGKGIVVRSEVGPALTIINCQGSGEDPHRGFYFTRGEGSNSVVEGFAIVNGKHSGGGGGIRCALASSPTILGNLIVGNEGPSGGGILCSASSPIIRNTTFTGNMAYNGGGLACVYHSDPQVINCILWGDTAETGKEIYVDGSSSVVVRYSDVGGGWPGEGNIAADPLFTTGALGDHYLSQMMAGQEQESPCVDAGDPYSPLLGGTTRTDGVADGWPVDMGFHYPEGVVVVAEEESEERPESEWGGLGQNHPNPFSVRTSIAYVVKAPSHVTLVVYDVRGAAVRTLVSGTRPAGRHVAIWDGTGGRGKRVGNGIYFACLSVDGEREMRPMVLLR